MNSTLPPRAEIRDVIEQYFYGLDSHNESLVRSCFAEEAFAIYHAGSDTEHTLKGNGNIARYFAELTRGFDYTSHSISNMHVSMEKQQMVHSDVFAVAHVVKNGRVYVRGLRYEDDLSFAEGAWRITKRRHSPLWQYDAEKAQPQIS